MQGGICESSSQVSQRVRCLADFHFMSFGFCAGSSTRCGCFYHVMDSLDPEGKKWHKPTPAQTTRHQTLSPVSIVMNHTMGSVGFSDLIAQKARRRTGEEVTLPPVCIAAIWFPFENVVGIFSPSEGGVDAVHRGIGTAGSTRLTLGVSFSRRRRRREGEAIHLARIKQPLIPFRLSPLAQKS